jgi:hypothetical protein
MKKLFFAALVLLVVACAKPVKMGASVPGDAVWLYGSSIDGGLPVNASFAGTIALGDAALNVGNFPSSQTVNGTVDASVVVTSMPATQVFGTIDASVVVSNVVALQSCNPVQQYGVMNYVAQDGGTHYFYSAYCFNSGTLTQYFQLQSVSTGPFVDAGPPVLEFAIPPNSGQFYKDPGAPGGVNISASANALAGGAIAWDVSGAPQWFIKDGGGSVNCNVCYQ